MVLYLFAACNCETSGFQVTTPASEGSFINAATMLLSDAFTNFTLCRSVSAWFNTNARSSKYSETVFCTSITLLPARS